MGKNTSKDTTIVNGTVLEALPNTMFKVELEDGKMVLTTLRGIMRKRYVRIFPGDKVKVEMTKYDDQRGRIVFKYGR
jgi:translation initiation factor IF-1